MAIAGFKSIEEIKKILNENQKQHQTSAHREGHVPAQDARNLPQPHNDHTIQQSGEAAQQHDGTVQQKAGTATRTALARLLSDNDEKLPELPYKLATQIVPQLVTQVLYDLKEETGGGFGTTPLEARIQQRALPNISSSLISIIK